ncbi:MAG: ABC transporter ATP-binding protein [Actinomycetales bacterium]|nr:ABC transporter ATP-binding protein [Actinomycetales bacterium]
MVGGHDDWSTDVTEPALSVDGLTIRYGSAVAVDGVGFSAPAGAITAILGPNGAGKTSTIEACTGLRRPAAGTIRVLGGSPEDPSVRARMGVMLQQGGLYPTARPLEWLRYLARLYGAALDPADLLGRLGIDPAVRTSARRLSGGQAQRVKLAAALLPDPDAMFLDEPTAGMDQGARRDLIDLLRDRRSHGRSVILTTHLIADVEDLADRVIVLARGRVIADGTLAELTESDAALRFEGPAQLDTAALLALLPTGYAVSEPEPGRYVVEGPPTPSVVSAVATWCARHGALAFGLRPGRRSIADILLAAERGSAA